MKVLIMAIILSLSQMSLALPTKKNPNARTLFLKRYEDLRKSLVPRALFPIPLISLIFHTKRIKRKNNCEIIGDYFNSAYKRNHKSEFSKEERSDAKKNLNTLLETIKNKAAHESLKRQEKAQTETLSAKEKKEEILATRIQQMNRRGLINLLAEADTYIPPILGNPKTGYANCNLNKFIESIYTLDKFYTKSPVSKFEAGLLDEKKEWKRRQRVR